MAVLTTAGLPYLEGAWTPVLTFATPGNLSVSYAQQTGVYTRIGRLLVASFALQTSAFTHTTASGGLLVTGLPFAAAGGTAAWGPIFWGGITKAGYSNVMSRVVSGGTNIDFGIAGSGVAPAVVAFGDTPTGGTITLSGNISYMI